MFPVQNVGGVNDQALSSWWTELERVRKMQQNEYRSVVCWWAHLLIHWGRHFTKEMGREGRLCQYLILLLMLSDRWGVRLLWTSKKIEHRNVSNSYTSPKLDPFSQTWQVVVEGRQWKWWWVVCWWQVIPIWFGCWCYPSWISRKVVVIVVLLW